MSRHFISQCFGLSNTRRQKGAKTGPGGDAQQGGKTSALAEKDPSEIRFNQLSCRAEPLTAPQESVFLCVHPKVTERIRQGVRPKVLKDFCRL